MEDDPYRLPRTVIPRRYELRLEPDLDAATFAGEVGIDVEVREPTGAIVLNAAELDLDAATVTLGGTEVPAQVSVDPDLERATLTLPETLPAGDATIRIGFTGTLNDKLHGFYRSTFTDVGGEKRTIATTQFESTDARRAFPCFDEPDLKATFAITLVVAAGLAAVSNGAEADASPTGDGRCTVRFAETMPMSTYLVAFVVGPLEATDAVDVDGVAVRVVHPPGKDDLTAYALDVAAFSLRFFADYYGIAYPGGKLDLVALPDFAFGAMENLGCVTFREALLLVDPDSVAQQELSSVADVIAHEIAHMWFGDLVTMRWWNGIWLNEAFATFMEVAAVDAFRPAWRRWEQFSLERSAAFDVDGLASTRPVEFPVVSPADAEGMFDVLTYQKGGSLLRMLEQYLGPDRFRDGIRRYLQTHAYANTETEDLWEAIGAAADAPVRDVMESWIFQGGHPLVSVRLDGDRRTVHLRQEQFRFLAASAGGGDGSHAAQGARWRVPVILRAHGAGGSSEHRILLDGETAELTLESEADVVVANAGAHGFYRVRYAPDLAVTLGTRARDLLAPVERYTLVDDTYAAVLAGTTTSPEFVALARRFGAEDDVDVWRALAGHLGELSRILDGDALDRFRALVVDLVAPVLDRLGWTEAPAEGSRQAELRGVAIRTLGLLGESARVQDRCRRLHDTHLAGGEVAPDVTAAATAVVAHTGTDADFDLFVRRGTEAPTPQEQLRYLYGLAEFPAASQIERTCEMTLDGTIRTQNAPYLLARALAHREHGPLAWQFVRDRWDRLNETFPSNSIVRMLGGIRALSRPDVAADVTRFFESHDVPQGRRQLSQHLERLHVNVALRAREADRLAAHL